MTIYRYPPLSVSTTSSPIQYVLNGGNTNVIRDTTTPTNSRPLPVEIMSASGVDISVTAANLNVEIVHNGSAPSSVRIGDGTTLAGVTVSNELKINDALLNIASGAPADTAASSDTGTFSIISFIKRGMQNWTSLLAKVPTLTLVGSALKVDNSAVTQPVSGTFWQTTQPVSIATMPTTPVTGTFWQTTQPVSGTVAVSNASIPVTQATASLLNATVAQGTANTAANAWTTKLTDGTNIAAVKAASTAAIATDPSVVVAISPNSNAVSVSNVVAVAQGALGSNYVELTNLTTTAQAILSNITCKKIYIQADSNNSARLRFKITNAGTAATTTSGAVLEPGRDMSFDLGGSSLNCTLSVIAESGTSQAVYVHYGV